MVELARWKGGPASTNITLQRRQTPTKDEMGMVRGARGQPPAVVRNIGAGELDANELGWNDTIRVHPARW
jgi:hypothetical protein